MCCVKYHVLEDRSSIVGLTGDVGMLRYVSAYHQAAWHFDSKFVNGEGHEMETYRKRLVMAKNWRAITPMISLVTK